MNPWDNFEKNSPSVKKQSRRFHIQPCFYEQVEEEHYTFVNCVVNNDQSCVMTITW